LTAIVPLAVVLAACAGAGGGGRDAGVADGADGDGGGADGGDGADRGPEIVDSGDIFVDACLAFGSACADSADPDCGKCQYGIRYRADACSADRPCDNLFLLWACMGCEGPGSERLFDRIFAQHPDFIAVCMQPNYPGEMLPSSLGAPGREAALVARVFERLRPGGDLGVWTGKNLLMAGCSAAASRYPVVAARHAGDADWVGTDKTGVCLSDGVVDVAYQDAFVGDMAGRSVSCAGRHRRVARGYTVAEPVAGHACADSPRAQCACDPEHAHLEYPGDCADGDCVAFDSIVTRAGDGFAFSPGVTADDFAVAHWKLVTEGGSWADTVERCDEDIVPAAPYAGLCALLDSDDGHECVHTPYTDRPHCSVYYQQIKTICIDWFLAL
jgi:hypothetical protein